MSEVAKRWVSTAVSGAGATGGALYARELDQRSHRDVNIDEAARDSFV